MNIATSVLANFQMRKMIEQHPLPSSSHPPKETTESLLNINTKNDEVNGIKSYKTPAKYDDLFI
jgi:hypothetical protein